MFRTFFPNIKLFWKAIFIFFLDDHNNPIFLLPSLSLYSLLSHLSAKHEDICHITNITSLSGSLMSLTDVTGPSSDFSTSCMVGATVLRLSFQAQYNCIVRFLHSSGFSTVALSVKPCLILLDIMTCTQAQKALLLSWHSSCYPCCQNFSS